VSRFEKTPNGAMWSKCGGYLDQGQVTGKLNYKIEHWSDVGGRKGPGLTEKHVFAVGLQDLCFVACSWQANSKTRILEREAHCICSPHTPQLFTK
jgi:hypothetical protein